jgi:hypothetical protein
MYIHENWIMAKACGKKIEVLIGNDLGNLMGSPLELCGNAMKTHWEIKETKALLLPPPKRGPYAC